MGQISKVYSVSDEEFIHILNTSLNLSDCRKKLGYKNGNGRHPNDLIRKRCKELNIDFEYLDSKPTQVSQNHIKYTLQEICVKDSIYMNLTRLKKRLVDENILEYKCAICGNTGTWQGKKLTLQLDHINGEHTDNRVENLRFLCPNCHSQTDTFGSRQRRTKP